MTADTNSSARIAALLKRIRANVRDNVAQRQTYLNPLEQAITPLRNNTIIVGACPSLDERKHELPELQKNGASIICMMRALKCIYGLLDPDAVVILEPADVFNDYHLMATVKTPLVCGLGANPELVQSWPGPVFATLPFSEPEMDEYSKKTGLPQINCFNSTLGYLVMMCRILRIFPEYIGCDFWFTKDKYYAEPYTDKPPAEDRVIRDLRYPAESGRLTSQWLVQMLAYLGQIEPFYILNREKLKAMVV
ncbi:MAG: 6-hydroxymethylpterin diphosphokinase MptE-like protein [bacterium]